VRKFTFADHYYEQLDIPDNQTEYIKYMNRKIDIHNQTKVSLSKKILHTIFDIECQSSEDEEIDIPIDDNVTLPKRYSNLSFYLNGQLY